MGYYDDIKVLETILGKDGKHKVVKVRYPSRQKVRILTVHLRRNLVPRQININSGKEVTVWMVKEGKFTPFFKHSLLKDSAKLMGVCNHCLTGAWAYIRVGVKTHVMWMKGEGKNIDFIKD